MMQDNGSKPADLSMLSNEELEVLERRTSAPWGNDE
jgi:hypothetical protein